MPKYVIMMTHREFLCAGEVTKETPQGYTVIHIEGCPHSHPTGRFPKENVVFECDDKAKVIRMMALYTIIYQQRQTVLEAAEKAFQKALSVITSQKSEKDFKDALVAAASQKPENKETPTS